MTITTTESKPKTQFGVDLTLLVNAADEFEANAIAINVMGYATPSELEAEFSAWVKPRPVGKRLQLSDLRAAYMAGRAAPAATPGYVDYEIKDVIPDIEVEDEEDN